MNRRAFLLFVNADTGLVESISATDGVTATKEIPLALDEVSLLEACIGAIIDSIDARILATNMAAPECAQ